jgi:hypothetical protein
MYEAKGERAANIGSVRVRLVDGQLVELNPEEYAE